MQQDAERWKAWLRGIVRDAPLHARWLNTLSLLEHIGSRKIVKALDSDTLDLQLLQHIAEEARHAFFFKRLSERVAAGACPTYEAPYVLSASASRAYIQGLDREVHDYLQRQGALPQEAARASMLAYLVVTTLIEERATAMYALYEEVLREVDSPLSLRSVLNEEDRHLQEMHEAFARFEGFAWPLHAPTLRQTEAQLFEAWLVSLEREHPARPSQGSKRSESYTSPC